MLYFLVKKISLFFIAVTYSFNIIAMQEEPCSIVTVSSTPTLPSSEIFYIEKLDTYAFKHVLSFLPLKDIVHNRQTFDKTKKRDIERAIVEKIEFFNKIEPLNFLRYDFSKENDLKKLVALSRTFKDINFPFLYLTIYNLDNERLNSLNSPAIFKNVKSSFFVTLSPSSDLKNFKNIITTTALNHLESLYFQNYIINEENLKEILESLPHLKNFTIEGFYGNNAGYKLSVNTIINSPFFPQYTSLSFNEKMLDEERIKILEAMKELNPLSTIIITRRWGLARLLENLKII